MPSIGRQQFPAPYRVEDLIPPSPGKRESPGTAPDTPTGWTATPQSTHIRRAKHDDTRELQVQFNDGSIYVYSQVPESVFHDFVNAAHPGKYFHANIRGRYETREKFSTEDLDPNG